MPIFAGLSPLARGTLKQAITEWAGSRFIPAGAGNTSPRGIRYRSRAVYPRWRGEHSDRRGTSALLNGLSPLARGTLVVQPDLEHSVRFIPAGAGNTKQGGQSLCHSTVYPRWRGEHLISSRIAGPITGLSPLARGTPSAIAGNGVSERFIPAGAGNTVKSSVVDVI
ncbi:Domain of uncharacterised function (DUF2825) [Klebsiella pneumoniae]|nr:Domain of uncharacterised function (DUF2825) [Klebsiella pneumoniae]SLW82813.1 Domain of uncharacterised function (DUF2825) [Klebsiella pneumoniae]